MFAKKPNRFKRGYLSEIDQFLQELNNLPGSKSDSRLDEEQKYARIFELRDNAKASNNIEITWKEF